MKSILATLVVIPAVVALTLASSAAPAEARQAPQSTGSAASLLRRAAYQETQKQESVKAIEIYREVVKRYPDAPESAKALERIAALEKQLGDEAAARAAQTQLEALRAKLAEDGADAKEADLTKRALDAKRAQVAKDRDLRAAALAKLPPDVQKRVEELRAKGLPPEEIRATLRREAAQKLRERDLRGEIERIIADGKKKGQSPAEIRARVRKLLEQKSPKGDDDGTKAKPKKGRLV